MLRVIDCEQNTPEWKEARSGIITASEMGKVLAKGEGKTRRKYMYQLIGERITGRPYESGWSSAHLDRGHADEPVARELYMVHADVSGYPVGFFRNHDNLGGVGYSPDIVCGDDGLAECKSRLPDIQAELLDTGKVPPAVKPQLQSGLWVAEREWIDYVSYCAGTPLFVQRVYRDDTYIAKMETEVVAFYAEMGERMERIMAHASGVEAA